jgi:hypothetical protein
MMMALGVFGSYLQQQQGHAAFSAAKQEMGASYILLILALIFNIAAAAAGCVGIVRTA